MNNIPDQLLLTYLDRLNNRPDVYAKQWSSGNKFGYIPVRKPITIEVIKSHLAGEITLGFYALDKDNNCKWLCFDSDSADGQLDKLAKLFQDNGWLVIREGKRPGRDGHLWLLFDKPVPAIYLRKLAQLFLRKAGIAESQFELFPAQDTIIDVGNLVRVPLGIHRKPGADNAIGWFESVPHNINVQLEWLCSQPINSADALFKLVSEIEARELISRKIPGKLPASKSSRAKIDWITYAKTNGFKLDGSFWCGKCPACKLTGRDKDNNHLWISSAGVVKCWRKCTFKAIVAAAQG